MRIMVADQDGESRHGIVELLQKWGHAVQEVLTVREAVELCRKKCPDLVLVDFNLSGQVGVELVLQIRQTGGHALWVPLIVMAQSISNEETLQCVEAGADDVLVKPISETQLKTKVLSAARHFNLKEEVFKVAHELVVVNRTLQNVVTQDVLTGISNSNSFDETLEREWFSAKKRNAPISLLLFNLDFFQPYNQTYGAELGDQAIKKVAEALKMALPPNSGFLARTIGDTFAVLLPDTPREEAFKMGEQLNKAIDNLKIPHRTSGCSDHITASFGVATVDADHFTKPWDLKDSADFGLYQAKHYGRNRGFVVPATEVIR